MEGAGKVDNWMNQKEFLCLSGSFLSGDEPGELGADLVLANAFSTIFFSCSVSCTSSTSVSSRFLRISAKSSVVNSLFPSTIDLIQEGMNKNVYS